MKKFLSLFSLTVLFAYSVSSHAILIEPYLGYNKGSLEIASTPAGDGDFDGVTYGGRLGFDLIPMFSLGADFSKGTMEYKLDQGTNTYPDYDRTTLGVFAMFNPIAFPLRFWAAYNFMDEIENDAPTGDTEKGSSIKFGTGFKLPVLPVSFNLEYLQSTYDKNEDGTTGIETARTNDVTVTSFILSVSAPLSF